jgi:predicted kinase
VAHLVAVTGLPGSGKSTFAKYAYPNYEHLETDQLFMKNGVYQFDPKMLPNYHQIVQIEAAQYLKQGKNVVVSNTFSRKWELEPYTKMPYTSMTVYYVREPLDFYNQVDFELMATRNVYGVPLDVIKKMFLRWEPKEGEIKVIAS